MKRTGGENLIYEHFWNELLIAIYNVLSVSYSLTLYFDFIQAHTHSGQVWYHRIDSLPSYEPIEAPNEAVKAAHT